MTPTNVPVHVHAYGTMHDLCVCAYVYADAQFLLLYVLQGIQSEWCAY